VVVELEIAEGDSILSSTVASTSVQDIEEEASMK
jgi:hypothetical protein